MDNYENDLIIFSGEEEEMYVGENGELGDEGNPGQGIVGVRESPENPAHTTQLALLFCRVQ